LAAHFGCLCSVVLSAQCWVLQQYIQLANCFKLLIIGAFNNIPCSQVLRRFVLPHNCSLAIANLPSTTLSAAKYCGNVFQVTSQSLARHRPQQRSVRHCSQVLCSTSQLLACHPPPPQLTRVECGVWSNSFMLYVRCRCHHVLKP
jgi:hypothetical protein